MIKKYNNFFINLIVRAQEAMIYVNGMPAYTMFLFYTSGSSVGSALYQSKASAIPDVRSCPNVLNLKFPFINFSSLLVSTLTHTSN